MCAPEKSGASEVFQARARLINFGALFVQDCISIGKFKYQIVLNEIFMAW